MNNLCITGLACAAASGCSVLHAGTLRVDPNVSGGMADGSSWTDAFDSFDDAISAATSGDDIWLVGGVYLPTVRTVAGDSRSVTFSIPDGVRVLGGFATGDISASTRTGTASILDGDIGIASVAADNAYNVVEMTSQTAGSGTKLDRLTIRNGQATRIDPIPQAGFYPDAAGAAVFYDSGSPSFVDCTFSNNFSLGTVGGGASQEGGAICLEGAVGSFTGCTFTSNSIEAGAGGAVWASVALNTSGTTVFEDCSFTSNIVEFSASGGGALNYIGPLLRITGCTFTSNESQDGSGGINSVSVGGAVSASGLVPAGSADSYRAVTIEESTFSSNKTHSLGGAINIGGSFRIRNCTFSDNIAGETNRHFDSHFIEARGGALNAFGDGSSEVFDCTFSGNVADSSFTNAMSMPVRSGNGGALGIIGAEVRNCLFSGNDAGRDGGAVSTSDADFLNCDFFGNDAGNNGGAISGTSNTFIDRCTIENNSANEEGGGVYQTFVGKTGVGSIQDNGLFNSVIIGNTADLGGGVFFGTVDSGPHPHLAGGAINCSFYDNEATTSGDAVYLANFPSGGSDVALLRNSVLWDNPASGGTTPIGLGSGITMSDVVVDYCVVEGGWSGGGSGTVLNSNPNFVDAANGDLSLGASSPAIDAGRNESIDDNGYVFDRDRANRFFDVTSVTDTGVGTAPIIDMGAFERLAAVPSCNDADIATPFGLLDLSDITAFLTAFTAMGSAADIAAPFGIWDLNDITAFTMAFQFGCP